MPREPREPASALLSALHSPWPSLQRAAARIVRQALAEAKTQAAAAELLGVHRNSLLRMLPKVREITGRNPHKAKTTR